ncbi:NYN domain-containing protein [Geodermatophilus sp. SYSU D01180]
MENLLGGPIICAGCVVATARAFADAAAGQGVVFSVVGASHSLGVLTAAGAWPSARHVWTPGKNGADHSLLDVLAEDVSARFQRVVIGSGDSVFAPRAESLRMKGCHVTVVGRRGAVSRRTRLAVQDVRFISAPRCKPRHVGEAG